MLRFFHLHILTLLGSAVSYPTFRDVIPNGNSVPHPCKANYLWHGVGHNNPLGGGSRNPFGLDFQSANYKWTPELCRKDSDGDGRTNGEELGDPDCIWTPGQLPAKIIDITHPGVCTGESGSICDKDKNWINCDISKMEDCAGVQDPETRNVTIRFPETNVSKEETSYVCMPFNLPSDGDYHLVAYEPFLDNLDVMHHIIIYGCDPTADPVPDEDLNIVRQCGMGFNRNCQSMIGLWAVGFPGFCVDGPVGYKIGTSGYKQAVLEFHWNNPKNVETYTDSSGMTLYYTPKLRPNDAGVLTVGQLYLEIPPKSVDVKAVGTCPSECSRTLIKDPINVFWAVNHMHYLGHKMKMEVFRNGVLYTTLTSEEIYNYDSPVEFKYSTAVQLLPGDEIVTTCHFKSLSRSQTTFYGEATNDEMCFGFLSFYPLKNMPFANCAAWKGISMCNLWMTREHEGCKWANFMFGDKEANATKDLVKHNCRPFLGCTAECKDILRRLYAEHPCMKGDVHQFIRNTALGWDNKEMQHFLAAADSCAAELAVEALQGQNDENTNGSRGPMTSSYSILVVLFIFLFL